MLAVAIQICQSVVAKGTQSQMFNKTVTIQQCGKGKVRFFFPFSCCYGSNSRAKHGVKHVIGNGLFQHSNYVLQVLNKLTDDFSTSPVDCAFHERMQILLGLIFLYTSSHLSISLCLLILTAIQCKDKLYFMVKRCYSIIALNSFFQFIWVFAGAMYIGTGWGINNSDSVS